MALMQSRKFKSAMIGTLITAVMPVLGQLAVALGMPEDVAQSAAEVLMWIVGILFGLHIGGTAVEDYAAKRDQPAVKSNGSITINSSPSKGGGINLPPTLPLLTLLMIGGCIFSPIGCTAATDRQVETVNTELAADLQTRGKLEQASIYAEFEGWRKLKVAELSKAQDESLKTLEAFGKLDAASARYNSDQFTRARDELNRQVDLAIELSLKAAEWYFHAADVVKATQKYYQAKDQALMEGALAFVEQFGNSYVSARGQPTGESESKAYQLMDQLHAELAGMLKARLGVVQ